MSRRDTFQRIKITKKVCLICGEEKDISDFRIQWRNPDGTKKKEPHEDGCRICSREMMLEAMEAAGHRVRDEDAGDPHEPTVY